MCYIECVCGDIEMRNRVKWGNKVFFIKVNTFFSYNNVTENFKTRKSEYNYN